MDMSVDPQAVGEPPPEADDYLTDANAEDPQTDPRAPAHEPAGAEPIDDDEHPPGSAP
jgi:hypothetical protein